MRILFVYSCMVGGGKGHVTPTLIEQIQKCGIE